MKPFASAAFVPRIRTVRAFRAFAAALGLWASIGFVGSARAESNGTAGVQRVAIVRLDFEGTVPDAVRDMLARRLVEGLTAVRLEVLAAAQVRERLSGSLAGCKSESCFPEVARVLDVSYLVTGRVAESSKTYAVSLDIINGRTGAAVASSRERCETCGFEEAGEKVALAAGSLRARLEALAREPARVVIRSQPVGAQVLLDGKPMGATPLDLEMAAGRHRVTLSHEGHVGLERTFTVVSGVDETLGLEMLRIPSKFPYRLLGWTGVIVGTAVIAGGIWALSRDGAEVSCAQDVKDPDGDCPKVWSTKAGGAAMLGLGAAAASLGGVFIYVGRESGTAGDDHAHVRLGYSGRF